MALPSQLTQFTSPILDKALKTGARGVTQTTTNYGVIGDAMFKKAQLDLNIANLQADLGVNKAKILSGLEMDRANLHLQSAEVMNNARYNAAQLKMQAEADDVSDMEAILGTIGGAASGAVAGFAMGGPPGAIAGGVIGGGVAYAGYSQGRQEGQMALQTVGLLSNAAVAIKGYSDTKKKEDGFKNVMDGINTAQGMMASATNPQDFQAAHAEYQSRMAGAKNAMAQAGYSPEEVAKFDTFANSQKGIYSMDADEFNKANVVKMGEMMRNDKLINSNPDQSVREGRLKEYLGNVSSSMDQINQYDPMKRMTKDHAMNFSNAHGQGDVARDMFNPATPVTRNNVGASQVTIQPAAPSASRASAARTTTPAATQTQAPVPQAPQVQQSGKPLENHIPFAPQAPQVPFRPSGTNMDDGMDMFTKPVDAEVAMTKLGQQTADDLMLNPKKGMTTDQENRATFKEKVKEWTTPGYKRQEEVATPQAPAAAETSSDARVQQANANIDSYSKQIDANLQEASKSNFMSKDGIARGEYVMTAKSGLDDVKELIPRLPHDNQLKSAAAKVYLQGLKLDNVGQAMGATIGMKGGIAGVLAGNVVGDTAGSVLSDFDAGKGSATVAQLLTEEERDALDQYYSAVMNTIPSFVKSGDATQVTNDEFRRTSDPFINYGQTEGQKMRTLEMQYKKLVNTSGAVAKFSKEGKKQFDYQQSTPIQMRKEADISKQFDVSLERQRGTNAGKSELIKSWEEEIGY